MAIVTNSEFSEHLNEQLSFLEQSLKNFPNNEAEAKRAASTVAILLHDPNSTGRKSRTKSLLFSHMNHTDIKFLETRAPKGEMFGFQINPSQSKSKLQILTREEIFNLVNPYCGLVAKELLEIEGEIILKYVPLFKYDNNLSNQVHAPMIDNFPLSLIYSCGLRRSELLNLKIIDIDSNRNLVIIKKAKGKKDRIAPLSQKTLVLLREYVTAYKPKEWLFEGQDKKSRYDERSLASVLKQAIEKTGIKKPVTLHWLRHSYATHLLENGTDLRYIQEILGHSRSTTTEIYTHVSNKSIQKVISPFDSL